MVGWLRGQFGRLSAVLLVLVVGAMAWAEPAPSSPAAALDAATIGTEGVANLTGLVTDALPFIVAAIGLGIVLRWVRRVFKF